MKRQFETGASLSFSIMTIHLFTFFVFVVARPIFTILTDYPGYLVANHLQPVDIYVALVLISIAIPLILTGLVAVAGVLGDRFRLLVQTLFCAGFAGVFALHLLGGFKTIPDLWKILLSGLVFVVFALLYYKKPKFSLIITVLSPVIVLFPMMFLFNQNIGQILQPEAEIPASDIQNPGHRLQSKPPIVMVVFDELSLVDLMNSEGNIDARRFPNFAKLSSGSTWYKNATTVSYATQVAVPAILSGQRPLTRKLPVFNEYPNNLFSLVDGQYTFHVIEPITRLYRSTNTDEGLAPSNRLQFLRIGGFLTDMSIVYLHIVLPKSLAVLLPVIDEQWGGFQPVSISIADQGNRTRKAMAGDHVQPLISFISDIGSYPDETLHFIHVLLPHRPLQYLPSGHVHSRRKSSMAGVTFPMGKTSKVLRGPQLLADRIHQKHLLQTAFVDKLLGQLITEMKSKAMYDESLLIVVADHGINYQPDTPIRYPTDENFGAVAFVPLFIKYPSQNHAVEIDTNAETIDILPTIVDVLDISTTWQFDGQSLLGDKRTKNKKKILLLKSKQKQFVYGESQYLDAKQNALERNISTFSLDDPRSDFFHYGEGLNLIGSEVAKLINDRVPCRVQSDVIGRLRHVSLSNKFLPTEMNGSINCTGTNNDQLLVLVGVNGIIQGVTRPYLHKGESLFNLILSDQVFQEGKNDVEHFVIRKQPALKP